MRADSSIIPALAVLINIRPGLVFFNALESINPVVSFVRGRCSEIMSDCDNTSFNVSSLIGMSVCGLDRLQPIVRAPNAFEILAVSKPIPPSPIIPIVLLWISSVFINPQFPDLTARSISVRRFIAAKANAMACSATALSP